MTLFEEFEEPKKGNNTEYQRNSEVKHEETVNVQEYWYVNYLVYEVHTLSVVEIRETKQNKETCS